MCRNKSMSHFCTPRLFADEPNRCTLQSTYKSHIIIIIIIIIITDLYSAFRSEDTEALDAAQED